MNKQYLFLLQYNNYFNRIVKKAGNRLVDYVEALPDDKYIMREVNFNPNDGIDTEQVVNAPAGEINFDYVLVYDKQNDEILSRWFVIQAQRTRLGQYRLSLHRDIMADYLDEIVRAPVYIEKAIVNTGSPLIFNSEGMLFNQIKKNEVELTDETGSRWIVGYVATNGFDTYQSEGTTISPGEIVAQPQTLAQETDLLYSDIAGYVGKEITNSSSNSSNTQFSIFYNWQKNVYDEDTREDRFDFQNRYLETIKHGDTGKNYRQYVPYREDRYAATQSVIGKQAAVARAFDTYGSALKAAIDVATGGVPTTNTVALSQEQIDKLIANQNKTLKDINNNVFVYSIQKRTSKSKDFALTAGNGGALWTAYNNWITIADEDDAYAINKSATEIGFTARTTYETYEITLSFAPDKGYKTSLKSNSRNLLNAPYKMFAIPYDACVFAWNPNPPDVGVPFLKRSDPAACRAVAAEIANNLSGSGTLYDIQVLPYCPVRELLEYQSGGPIGDLAGTHYCPTAPYDPSGVVHSLIVDNTGEDEIVKGIVFFAESDSFSFTIEHEIAVPADNIEFKVEHETSMYRLNSPNYSGSFEFKATSNRGVSGFEVNCTYKPFQPYIHVNPQFNTEGLYGGDYNDARGLVCSGDFTFPTTSEAWTTYQIQNKSYADAHDRQITNMEETYSIQREQMKTAGIIGAITTGLSGVGTGITAGVMTANPAIGVGTAVAGVIGGALSGAGLAQDLKYADQLQAESKQYAKDMYQMNLRNIQAQPYTLGRVGGLTINTKRCPFLEYYTATDTEKQALRDKLTYNGMTINAIGTINEYTQPKETFIQGQLIRLEGLTEDYHLTAAIAAELHKGIFIQGG